MIKPKSILAFLILGVLIPIDVLAISIPSLELPFGGKVDSVSFCDCSFTFLIKYSPLFLGAIKVPPGLNLVTTLVYSPFSTTLYAWGQSIKVPLFGGLIKINYDPTVLTPGAWHLGKYNPVYALDGCVTGAPKCVPIPSLGEITFMGTSKGLGKPTSLLGN